MQSEFIEINGLKTHFVTYGEGNEVMIFLHGWGGNAKSFEKIIPLMQEKLQMKIIVPDLPGFGESENPDEDGWTTHQYEKWLEGFLEALQIKQAYFYGHSFGCRVLVRMLLKRPELAKKVILTGAAGIKWPPTPRQKLSRTLSKKCERIKKIIPFKAQKWILHKIFKVHDWGKFEHMETTRRKVVEEADFREELVKIQTPILLIWGANDTYTPLKSGYIFSEKLPHSRLEVFADGRHGIHYSHTNKIVGLVGEFLES